MELKAIYEAYGLIGKADGRDAKMPGEVYLLDERLCVLGQYAVTEIAQGAPLLSQYPASRVLEGEVRQHLLCTMGEGLLFPTRRDPVLLICEGLAAGGAALAICPPAGIGEILGAPAGFYHLLPHLSISERLLAHSATCSAAGVRLVTEWYHRIYRAFTFGKEQTGEGMLHAMAVRLHRLAELLGCCVDLDLCGFVPRHGERIEWELFTWGVVGAMLAAGRLSPTRELQLRLLRSQLGEPLLYLEFDAPQGDALPELATLRRSAAMRGTVCESFWQAEQGRTVLRISLCYAPLEVQDVKERHPLLSRAAEKAARNEVRPISRECLEMALELRFDEEKE